ncbi:DNA-binding anti-repressor SinI [Mesobacillus campisalis]
MEKMELGELDLEWVELIKEALEMGLDKEEIRRFLNSKNEEVLMAGS